MKEGALTSCPLCLDLVALPDPAATISFRTVEYVAGVTRLKCSDPLDRGRAARSLMHQYNEHLHCPFQGHMPKHRVANRMPRGLSRA